MDLDLFELVCCLVHYNSGNSLRTVDGIEHQIKCIYRVILMEPIGKSVLMTRTKAIGMSIFMTRREYKLDKENPFCSLSFL